MRRPGPAIHQIRLVPQRHGTGEHGTIYAAVARALYMPHLTPDFAYIHEAPFYEPTHFFQAYEAADQLTAGFSRVTEVELANTIGCCPGTLLVFRTLLGLTKEEFAHSSVLAGNPADLTPLSSSQIDTMERSPIPEELPLSPGLGQRSRRPLQLAPSSR